MRQIDEDVYLMIKNLRNRLERLERANPTAATRWEPLTNGDGASPALVFLDGDVVMVEEDI